MLAAKVQLVLLPRLMLVASAAITLPPATLAFESRTCTPSSVWLEPVKLKYQVALLVVDLSDEFSKSTKPADTKPYQPLGPDYPGWPGIGWPMQPFSGLYGYPYGWGGPWSYPNFSPPAVPKKP